MLILEAHDGGCEGSDGSAPSTRREGVMRHI